MSDDMHLDDEAHPLETPLPEGALARVIVYGSFEEVGEYHHLDIIGTELRITPGAADATHPQWLPNFLRTFADRVESGDLVHFED